MSEERDPLVQKMINICEDAVKESVTEQQQGNLILTEVLSAMPEEQAIMFLQMMGISNLEIKKAIEDAKRGTM